MTAKQFEKEIIKWAKELKIKAFYFNRDDSMEFAACVGGMNNGKPFLTYNLSWINEYKGDWPSILFHEFGHIKYKHYVIQNNNIRVRIQKEYQAEKYAFEMIKKYFPKTVKGYVKRQMKMINDNDWGMRWPVHQEAFRKVYSK